MKVKKMERKMKKLFLLLGFVGLFTSSTNATTTIVHLAYNLHQASSIAGMHFKSATLAKQAFNLGNKNKSGTYSFADTTFIGAKITAGYTFNIFSGAIVDFRKTNFSGATIGENVFWSYPNANPNINSQFKFGGTKTSSGTNFSGAKFSQLPFNMAKQLATSNTRTATGQKVTTKYYLDLSYTDFSNATIVENTFYTNGGVTIDLTGAKFIGARFEQTSFNASSGTIDLTDANFSNAVIQENGLNQNGGSIILNNTNFSGATLFNPDESIESIPGSNGYPGATKLTCKRGQTQKNCTYSPYITNYCNCKIGATKMYKGLEWKPSSFYKKTQPVTIKGIFYGATITFQGLINGNLSGSDFRGVIIDWQGIAAFKGGINLSNTNFAGAVLNANSIYAADGTINLDDADFSQATIADGAFTQHQGTFSINGTKWGKNANRLKDIFVTKPLPARPPVDVNNPSRNLWG
jgi:hypothetical protein